MSGLNTTPNVTQVSTPPSAVLDVAKGIASCCVILGHAVHQTHLEESSPQVYNFLYRLIFSCTMATFFIISGYLWSKNNSLDSRSQLKKDARSLLYPFLVLSIIFESLLLITGTHDLNAAKKAIFAVALFQSDSEHLPSGVLWFLFSLFSFRQIALIAKKSKFNIPINISICIAGTALIVAKQPFPLLALDRLHYYVFFFIGTIPNLRILQIRKLSISRLFALILATITVAAIMAIFMKTTLSKVLIYSKIIYFCGVPSLFGISFILRGKLQAIFQSIGTYSIYPYVFHMPIFLIAKKAFNTEAQHSWVLTTLILATSGIVGSQILGLVIRKIPYATVLLFGKTTQRRVVQLGEPSPQSSKE